MKKFTFLFALMAFMAVNVVGQSEEITSNPTWDGSNQIDLCDGGSFVISITATTSGNTYTLTQADSRALIQSIVGTGGDISFDAVTPALGNTSYSVFDAADFSPFINFTTNVVAQPTAPSMTKSPNSAAVCAGTDVSATIAVAGSGGVSGCTDSYEYSTNGGIDWSAYTPGTAITTGSLSGTDVVKIMTTRADSEGRGCDASNVYSWTVNTLPIPTLSGDDEVCANSTYTYTTESGESNYSWSVNGGTITSGGSATDNTAAVTWGATGAGDVSVNYDNAAGCSATNPTQLAVTNSGTVHNTDQDIYYCSIQDAIDDAGANEHIVVAAGTYTEQLLITTENLFITGADKSTTIIKSPAILSTSFDTKKAIVCAHTVNNFYIKNFTIDGDGKGNANNSFLGLAYWNSGGTVIDVDVTKVRETPFSGTQHGVGVYSYNDTDGPYTLSINGMNVTDFQKTAIALQGVGMTVDIDNVNVTGVGGTSITAQNGIQISTGAGGTLDDCTISDIIYTGASWTATGLLLIESGTVTATNVDIDNCQTSVYFQDSEGSYEDSDITNPAGDGVLVYNPGSVKSLNSLNNSLKPLLLPSVIGESTSVRGPAAVVSVTVDNCTITGAMVDGMSGVGGWAASDVINLTVTNSSITNWVFGTMAYNYGAEFNTIANNNNLSGNTVGFWTNCLAEQDTEDNWWGAANGPYNDPNNTCGTGSQVVGNVDFMPWWTDAGMTTPSGVLPVQNTDQGTFYCTIQDAIDDAALNNVIEVSDGTYAETINIHIEGLHLISVNGAASTTIDGGGGTGEELATIRFSANNITLEGFTIDNNNAVNGRAVGPKGSDGATIKDNIFANTYRGVAGDWYGRPTNLTVTGNTFDGASGVSYGIVGTEDIDGLIITNNTFTNLPKKGVSLGVGVANLTLSGNSFSNITERHIGNYDPALPFNVVTVMAANTFDLAAGVDEVAGSMIQGIYPTISLAVDNAEAGTTVHVLAGTYTENVTVDKSLELRGAQYNTDPRGTAWTTNISTVDANGGNYGIYITVADVTVNGFKVINAAGSTVNLYGGIGVVGASPLAGIDISYNWLSQNSANGIFVSNVTAPVVEYNYCSNNGDGLDNIAGISLYASATQTITNGSVSNNECYQNTSYGIYIASGANLASSVAGIVINNNEIHSNTKYGLQLLSHNFQDAVTALTVSGNMIYDNTRNGLKIVSTSLCDINSNEIYSNGAGGSSDKYMYGVMMESYLGKTSTGNSFTENSIYSNTLGGVILQNTGGSYTGNAFNNNSFVETGTNLCIDNLSADNIDATCNWWGSTDAAVVATKVNGNVQFLSFLTDGTDNEPGTPGFQPVPGSCNGVGPVTNITQGTTHMTIQAAIDEAVANDVIEASAGTYEESIYISKSLELHGPNYGISGTSSSRVAEAIIQLPNGTTGWDALIYSDIEYVVVDGFTLSDAGGVDGDVFTGWYSYSSGNVRASNNIVDGFSYVSFLFNGGGYPSSTPVDGAVVSNNYFTNNHGLYHTIYLQGIGGTVSGNTVENCAAALQIQPYSQPTGGVVQNNSFEAYGNGIYHNYANLGSGKWTYTNNLVSAVLPPAGSKRPSIIGIGEKANKRGITIPENIDAASDNLTRDSGDDWIGIHVRTHGTSGTGAAPEVEFITGNNVDGAIALTDPYWADVIGLQFRNTGNSALTTFENNSITNVDYGIKVYDDTNNGSLVDLDGNTLSNYNYAILVEPDMDIDASSGNTYDGVASGTATLAELFTIEDAIIHKIDESSRGFVTVIPNNDYVTVNSFAGVETTPSIQRGIDAASTGWTVNVNDGTYLESPKIETSLTLKSANGRDVTTIALQAGTTSYGSLHINAATVTVDGFTIEGFDDVGTVLGTTNIYLTTTATDVGIKNNRVKVATSTGYDNGIGILTTSGSGTMTLLVDNNLFVPVNTSAKRPFYINPGVLNFTFTNNSIIGDFQGTAITQAYNGFIEDNIVTGAGAAGSRSRGLGTWGNPDASLYGNTIFRGNNFSNLGKAIAIYSSNNITIEKNIFSNNDDGVWVTDGEPNFDPTTIAIHDNSITGSYNYGINNTIPTPTSDLNTTCNWWGTSVAAEVEAAVAGPVQFLPFLVVDNGGSGTSYWWDTSNDYSCDGVGPVLVYDDDPNTTGTLVSSHMKIQDAINTATTLSGYYIEVSAGTYVETGQIVIDKNLTITGADKTTTIIKPDANQENWFQINTGIVLKLSKVKLDGTGKTVTRAINYQGTGTVNDCWFTQINGATKYANGISIQVKNPSNVNVTNCTFDNIGRSGIRHEGTGSVTGNTYTGKGDGDWLDYFILAEYGCNITIDNNTVTNCTGVASSDGSTSSALAIWDDLNTTATITNNVLTNNSTAIGIAGINSSDPAYPWPHVTIGAGNLMEGGDYGIVFGAWGTTYTPTITFGASTIKGQAKAVVYIGDGIGVGATYDISNLVFQDASGTTITDNFAKEDLVVHTIDAGNRALFSWVPNNLFVTENSFLSPTTTTPSIQRGIDAASNIDWHTIHVDAGTYVESGQIFIDKDLTISGSGIGSTIVKTDQNTGNSGDARGWWLVDDGVTFHLNNMTLDGIGYDIYQGIRHKGGGTIDAVEFTNMVYPNYAGVGLAAFNTFGMNIDITNSSFSNIGRVGVLYFGADITGSDFHNNTYTGKGAGDWLDYGVEVGAGAIVDIDNFTVSANTGVASTDQSTSAGILVSTYYGPGSTATISNSSINGNSTGVAVGFDGSDASSVIINDNDLSGNDYGVTTSAPTVDASCNWWGTTDPYAIDALTSGDVQFLPYWTTDLGPCDGLGPVVNITQGTSFMSIQNAIDDALTADGNVIEVQIADYTEPGYVTVSKSLTIQGQGKTVTTVRPNINTSTAGHGVASAIWISTAPGKTVHFKDMTLDATGWDIKYGVVFQDDGSLVNVGFNEFKHSASPYLGIAAQILDGNLDVNGCTFTEIGRIGVHYRNGVITGAVISGTYNNNTYTGKGAGDWLDYALDISGETAVTVTNNTITNCLGVASSDGSTSGAVMATTYFPLGLNVPNAVTITDNDLTGNTAGVKVGYDANDVSVVTITNNKIYGNDFGVISTAPPVDAKNNWWGDASGPYNDPHNTCGTGDIVEGPVDFIPWWTDAGMTTLSDDLPVKNITQSTYYCTIQDAVDDAVTGDQITVAAGSYEEQITVDDLTLTITGAGNTSTFINAPINMAVTFTTSYDAYAVVGVINDASLMISDLTIDGLGRGNNNYKMMGVAFRNAAGTVDGCKIVNIENTPFSGLQHGVGVYAYNDDAVSRTINVTNNEIENFQKNGMALNAGMGTTALAINISGNTVTGHGATTVTAQNGIQTYGDLITGTITGNTISGIAYDNTSSATKWVATSILNFYSPIDILSNTITGAHMGIYNIDASGTIASNNLTIEKIGVYAFGIIGTDPPNAVPQPYDEPTAKSGGRESNALLTVAINDNTVLFSGADNTATYGIEVDAGWGPDDLLVSGTGNDVSGFEVGFEIYMCESGCDAGVFTGVLFDNNQIYDNTIGMRSNVSYLTVDAKNNWWGDASGPYNDPYNTCGTGDIVEGLVDFIPWWTTPTGGTSPALPVQNTDQTTFYCSIQDAIDDALTGEHIVVAAGTYVEQLYITTENLFITGAGVGSTVVESPDNLTLFYATSANNYPIVFVDAVNDVHISDLTIDGANKGNANYRFQGIGFYNAGGTLQNAAILNVMDATFSGSQHGNGLYAFADDGGTYNLTVDNVQVLDYQKGGITINSAGLIADISNCTVVGQGATNITAQNGIQFWAASGTVDNCSVSSNIYTGDNWLSTGMLVFGGANVDVTNTTLTDNYVGIDCEDSEGTFDGGTITNTDPDSWDGLYVRNYAGVKTPDGDQKYERRASPSPDNVVSQQGGRANQSFTLSNTTVTGFDRQYSWGVFVYGKEDVTTVNITGCTITHWGETGIYAKENGGTVAVTANMNEISSNGVWGFNAISAAAQDANNNFWGDETGAYHDPNNTCGTGNAVSDNVDFYQWWTDANMNVYYSLPDPNITCLSNQIRCADETATDTYTTVGTEFDPTVVDVCRPTTISNDQNASATLSGYVFDEGTTTVTWTITDVFGNNYYCIFDVTINALPDPVISGDFEVCAGAMGVAYSTPLVSGNSYLWSVTGGAIASGQGTNAITVDWDNASPGTVSITEYAGGTFCSETVTKDVTLIALPTPEVTGAAAVVVSTTETYSTTDNTFHAYTWAITGGTITSGQGTHEINVLWPAAPGTGTITVTELNLQTGCIATSDVFNVTITTGGVDVHGHFTYHNGANTPLGGLALDLMDGVTVIMSTTTDTYGYYEFNNVPDGTFLIVVTSTLTPGGVNSSDAGQVNLWGTIPSSIEHVRWNAGNVSASNYINATDAGRIQAYLVYGTPFGRGDWTFWKQPDASVANPPTSTNDIVVNGSNVSQDFYGLSVGDFNSSYTPGSKSTFASDLMLTYNGTLMVGSDMEFELPIKVTASMQVAAVTLILNIPSHLVTVEDVFINNGGIPSDAGSLDFNVDGNELRIGWNTLQALDYTDGNVLLSLKLRTTEFFGSGDIIEIALSPSPLNELADGSFYAIENVVLSTYSVEYSVTGIGEFELSKLTTLESYPNPFNTFTNINYSIPVDGEVILEIYDMFGSRVKTLVDETQRKGDHSVKFHALAHNAGVYTVNIRVKANGHVVSRTIKIVINSN